MRCVHENSLHDSSQFLTLTYDEDLLPEDGGLNKSHLQKFMKRYRRHLGNKKIRFYACGEYGDSETKRPHYHALIFGHEFSDKEFFRCTDNGDNLYLSATLDRIWSHGHCQIGAVTFESAAYVARYIMKKVKANEKDRVLDYCGNKISTREYAQYSRCDPQTGEATLVTPEFTTMSRRPGIGQGWYQKYGGETYRDDYIIINGVKCQPPKYYDEQYPDIQLIKQHRKKRAIENRADNTTERLLVKERCKILKMDSLKRNLGE